MQSAIHFIATYSIPTFLTILFFALSIVVHEFGHFIAAKVFRLYVPKFSIGFGKTLLSKKIFGTEFCISMLPFGGYVSIPQLSNNQEIDINITLPKDLKKISPIAKIIISAMGPLFNLAFAIGIAFFLYFNGIDMPEGYDKGYIGYVNNKIEMSDRTSIDNPIHQAGIRPGDLIISIDGIKVQEFSDIYQLIALGSECDDSGKPISKATVSRKGNQFETIIHPILLPKLTGGNSHFRTITGLQPKTVLTVRSTIKGSASDKISLRPGDIIISANGKSLYNVLQLKDIVNNSKSDIYVTAQRDNTKFIYNMTPQSFTYSKPHVILNKNKSHYIIPSLDPFNVSHKIDQTTKFEFKLFFKDIAAAKEAKALNGVPITYLNNIEIKTIKDIEIVLNRLKLNQKINIISINNNDRQSINIPFDSFESVPQKETLIIGMLFEEKPVKIHKTPHSQISHILQTTYKTIYSLLTPKSNISINDMMGPAGIIKQTFQESVASFSNLLWFIMLININLAVFNLLPLPILDGGHIAIGALQLFIKGNIVEKVFNWLQSIFLFLLLSLILYITFLDFKRMIINRNLNKESYIESKILITPEKIQQ